MLHATNRDEKVKIFLCISKSLMFWSSDVIAY